MYVRAVRSCAFLCAQRLEADKVRKVYGEKCMSRRAVYNSPFSKVHQATLVVTIVWTRSV